MEQFREALLRELEKSSANTQGQQAATHDQRLVLDELRPSEPLGHVNLPIEEERVQLFEVLNSLHVEAGLRKPPYCGPRENLEAVYNAVHASVTTRTLRIIEIAGQPGFGARRLLTEALSIISPEERGIDVIPLIARAGDSLRDLLGQWVRALFGLEAEMPGHQAYETLHERLEGEEVQRASHTRLLAYIAGVRGMGPGSDALAHDIEAHWHQAQRALVQVLRSKLQERAIILVLAHPHVLRPQVISECRRFLEHLHDEPLALALLGEFTRTADADESKLTQPVRVELKPLAGRDLERFFHALFANFGPIEEVICKEIQEQAQGNPRLILESARLLLQQGFCELDDEGLLVSRDGASFPRLPRTLDESSELRISRLIPETRRVLQVAAVFGMAFDSEEVASVLTLVDPDYVASLGGQHQGLPLTEESQAEQEEYLETLFNGLSVMGVLVQHQVGRWRFRHGNDRERLLRGVDAEQHKHLHALVAQFQELRLHAEPESQAWSNWLDIAGHWHLAGRRVEGAHTLLMAAEQAETQQLSARARLYYQQALEALGAFEPKRALTYALPLADVAQRYAQLALRMGLPHEARLLVKLMWEQARVLPLQAFERHEIVIRSYLYLARAMRAQGLYAAAQGALDIAHRERVRTNTHHLTLELTMEQAYLAWVMGDGGYALVQEQIAVALEVANQEESPRELAELYGLLANVHLQQGAFEDARLALEHALEYAREAFDSNRQARSLLSLGAIAFFQGEVGEAIEQWRESLSVAEALGERELMGALLNNIGEARLEQDELEHAAAALLEARTLCAETGDLRVLTDVLKNLASLEQARGQLERALDYADEAVVLAKTLQVAPAVAPALRTRALIRFRQAKAAGELALVERAEADLAEARALFAELGDQSEVMRTDALAADLGVTRH